MAYQPHKRGTLDYNLLWDREDPSNSSDLQFVAQKTASTWSGFPPDPSRPIAHSLEFNMNDVPLPIPVIPVKSTRKRRGRGYCNLSNYNTIP